MLGFGMAYLFLISVINFAVGFMAALYLGRGPRCWQDVRRAFEFKEIADLSEIRWTRWFRWLQWLRWRRLVPRFRRSAQ